MTAIFFVHPLLVWLTVKENTNRAHEKVDVIMSRPNFGQLWLMELQGVVMIYTQEIRAANL